MKPKTTIKIIVVIACIACVNMAGAQWYFFSRYRVTKKGQALGAVELMG